VFRELHQRDPRPRVRVSTNSLAATDAFPVYAMSHKYKRLYLREFGFTIHEFKPFPLSAPIDLAATGAPGLPAGIPVFGSGSAGSAGSVAGPVPLRSAGVRVGLHAKSMVIDGRVAIVGSHNFDPRSDNLNTESLVVVHDAGFAAALTASIEGDMAPENAWLIGPRPRLPLVAQFHYNLGKLSERLPIFDIWPFPYATSYQLRPDCPEADWRAPAPWRQPDFERCWDNVGDFPEVDLPLKSVYTRILTAFGAGLVPIL
jgi:phosphatidylserine/phosphatidylglycerophosphate/cardiolipin synthase-like enzyme